MVTGNPFKFVSKLHQFITYIYIYVLQNLSNPKFCLDLYDFVKYLKHNIELNLT